MNTAIVTGASPESARPETLRLLPRTVLEKFTARAYGFPSKRPVT